MKKRALIILPAAVLTAAILAGTVVFLDAHPFVEIPESAAAFVNEERLADLHESAHYGFGLCRIRVVSANEGAVSAVFTYLPFAGKLGCTHYYKEDGSKDYGEYWRP